MSRQKRAAGGRGGPGTTIRLSRRPAPPVRDGAGRLGPAPEVDSSGAGMSRRAAGFTAGLHTCYELITQALVSKPPVPPAATGRSASDLKSRGDTWTYSS